MEDGLVGDTELRYRSLYEQQSNPFASMGGDKRMGGKYSDMTMADKITLSTTRMFLSSKPARNFAFFYVLFLHLLVFITVFHWSHSAQCAPLPPPKQVITHMVGAPTSIIQDSALTELVGRSV
jgi:homeobox protein cut-like